MFCGVVYNVSKFDVIIKFYFGCLFEELDVIEKVILCIVMLELIECIDVFYCVIINEVIEFVKVFGVEESYKFINGVLDKVVCILCKDECD